MLGFSGMRIGEAASLEWKNIDLDNKIIHVKANSYYQYQNDIGKASAGALK